MWGVWVATAGGLDFPLARATTQNDLEQQITHIISMCKNTGIRTLFFQARACGDAYYHSALFPRPYDLPKKVNPLATFIDLAHANDIELHAWINPYRVKYPDSLSKEKVDSCYEQLGKQSLIYYKDGSVHLNPASDIVVDLMVSCIDELLENYEIDGIHMDDRYYPGRDVEDGIQVEGDKSLGDIRRAHVTRLVRAVHHTVKTSDRQVFFGVSPCGIWAHRSSHPLGSTTRGVEAYHDHYADVMTWIREGLIDYCIPQLYYRYGDPDADYKALLKWWIDRTKETDIDLVIGHGAYLVNDKDSPLFDLKELEKQLRLNSDYPSIKGSAFFRASSIMDNPHMAALIRSWIERNDR